MRTTNRRINRFAMRHVFSTLHVNGVPKSKKANTHTAEHLKESFAHDEPTNHILYKPVCAVYGNWIFAIMQMRIVCISIHATEMRCQMKTILHSFHPFILHHINGAYFIVNRSCHRYTHTRAFFDVAWSAQFALDCSNQAKRNINLCEQCNFCENCQANR